jgi:hypothetical protein
MQTRPLYFPILRAKTGEIEALGHLSDHAKFRTMPVLDVPEPSEEGHSSTADHFYRTCDHLKQSWGTALPLCLDLSRYSLDTPSLDSVALSLFDSAREARLIALPVAGALAFRGSKYLTAVATIARQDGHGIALRLATEDFEDAAVLAATLDESLSALGLPTDRIDLILDFEAITRTPSAREGLTALTIALTATQTATRYGFRRIALSGSSVPEPMSMKKIPAHLEIERQEFEVWKDIIKNKPATALMFSDYGVIPPFQSKPTRNVKVPARIRFPTTEKQIFLRGPRKDYGSLAESASAKAEFRGLPPSWGANAVRECAGHYGTPGGPSQWVARDTNMHIEATVAHVEAHLRNVAPDLLGPPVKLPKTAWLQESLSLADSTDRLVDASGT